MKKYPATICSTLIGIVMSSLLSGCATSGGSHATPTLKDAYKNDFMIGVAVNQKQFDGEDPRGDPIIKAQFNSISPENVLKWESVHPQPGTYAFEEPDRYVDFGESNHMYIIGHTLIWHNQTPRWVFQAADGRPLSGTNAADREFLLQRMHDHIQTVVGRYKGRIKVWDVVNEALNENGTLRKSPWEKIIGDDYIEKAFQYAHEADPDAILRYNDYSLENEPKRNGAIALIKKLQAEGVPVTAIGLQDHDKLNWPTPEQEDAAISAFAKLGLKVMITELDIDTSPSTQRNRSADINLNGQEEIKTNQNTNAQGPSIEIPLAVQAALKTASRSTNGLPDVAQQFLAKRYSDLFNVFLKHRNDITLVTFWGVTDGDSWLNRGRVNHPLLFDRAGQPKLAFYAVIQTAQNPQDGK
jgi:endo-1,4-beta-xylanase